MKKNNLGGCWGLMWRRNNGSVAMTSPPPQRDSQKANSNRVHRGKKQKKKRQTVRRRGGGARFLPRNHICALCAVVEAVLCNLNVCFLQYALFFHNEVYRRTPLGKMQSAVRFPHAMAAAGWCWGIVSFISVYKRKKLVNNIGSALYRISIDKTLSSPHSHSWYSLKGGILTGIDFFGQNLLNRFKEHVSSPFTFCSCLSGVSEDTFS